MAGLVWCGAFLVQCFKERLSVLVEKTPHGGAGHIFSPLEGSFELEYRGMNAPVMCKRLFHANKETNALVLVHESRIYYAHVRVENGQALWDMKGCCGVQRDRTVAALAVSPFVQEECAFLDTANEIVLDPLAASKYHGEASSTGQADGYSGFRQLSELPLARSFCFTAHPRTFAVCRGNTLQRVDLREPHDCEEVMCRLERERCEYCNGKCLEDFMLVEKAPSEKFGPFAIAAVATRQVMLYDVRMVHAPLFSFAHRTERDPEGIEFIEDRMFLWTKQYTDQRCFRLAKRNEFRQQLGSNGKSKVDVGLVEQPYYAIEAPRKATGMYATWSLDTTRMLRQVSSCAPVSATRMAVLVNDSELFVDEYV